MTRLTGPGGALLLCVAALAGAMAARPLHAQRHASPSARQAGAARPRPVGRGGVRATWMPRRPGTGSLAWLVLDRLRTGDSVVEASGTMAGEPLHFHAAPAPDARLHALAAVPLGASDSVVARVGVRYVSGVTDSAFVRLVFPHRPPQPPPARRTRRTPRARRLRVARQFTAPLDSATNARIERENAEARETGRRSHDTPRLWSEPWLVPRNARITSWFGTGRVFNGRVASSHGGVDFAGRAGEPVRVANRGVVAIVDSFFLAGNVVYVDHGEGVVTGYFHLSEAHVAVGDTVARGQELGLVGATGRVTGPHLHWSARYGALSVDPMDLVTLTGGRATVAARRTRKASKAASARAASGR